MRKCLVPHDMKSRGRRGLELVNSGAQWLYQAARYFPSFWAALCSDLSPFITRSLSKFQTSPSPATTQCHTISLLLGLHPSSKEFSQKPTADFSFLNCFWCQSSYWQADNYYGWPDLVWIHSPCSWLLAWSSWPPNLWTKSEFSQQERRGRTTGWGITNVCYDHSGWPA